MAEQGFVSVPEAAVRLGLTQQQVYRRIFRGDLKASREIKGGRAFYKITDADLQSYIDAGSGLTPTKQVTAYVSAGEAAQITGLSVPMIRKMCHNGMIKAMQFGERGHFRILREDLAPFVK